MARDFCRKKAAPRLESKLASLYPEETSKTRLVGLFYIEEIF